MMEIGSPRLPLSKGKYQWSCIWGLVDMFDFRTGRTHQKLLSNGKARHKHGFDAQHSRKVDMPVDLCEKCQYIEGGAVLGNHAVDDCKSKVKDIMQEEFPTGKQIQKLLKAMKHHERKSDLADNHKKASKTSKKASQILANHKKAKDHEGHHPCSCSDELSLDNHKFAAMLEEICSQIHQDGRFNGDIQRGIIPSRFKQLDEINVQLLQMSAKAFIDQIYIKRRYMSKGAISSKSKPFSDASEILQLNRELFLKLLQDPNSLLVKHIQKLQLIPREERIIKSFPSSQSSECQSSGTSDYEDFQSTISIQKRSANNLLWQKLKHGFSSKRNTSSTSNAIVVLKPGSNGRKNPENVSCHCSSLQSHHSLKNKQENNKSTYFSFKQIKRKLKRAGGEREREQHLISLDDSLNRLYRNKNSLKYVGKGISHIISKGETTSVNDAKRMEKGPKPKGLISHKGPEIDFNSVSECKNFNSSTTSCSKQQSDIFIEAKRHLSERFRKLNVAETLPRKQTPRTLQMILSSPDHDYSITRSPKSDTSSSVSMQMRFFPYSDTEKGNGVSWPSPQKHNEEVQLSTDSGSDDQMEASDIRPNVPEKISDDIEGRENICATGDDLKPTGYVNVMEENECLLPGNMNISEVPCERDKVDCTCCGPSTESTKLLDDDGYKSSSLADSSEHHQHRSLLRPSSSPLDISALEIVDACKYREGHPSPVSVLDPFSPEDANSPTTTTAKQDESPLQPRCIDFDDHLQVESPEDPKVDITESTNEEEYMSAYVRAVMQASNFKFEELSAFSPCLPHVLDNLHSAGSVGLFQVDANCELNLLLDCIHEVLLRVYSCYFGYSPWLSFLKPNIRPAPLEANVVEEVVKEVNCYISPKRGQPTLDQLAEMDVAKFGLWFELRPDAEDIVIQIADDVLQESMMDIILELQI